MDDDRKALLGAPAWTVFTTAEVAELLRLSAPTVRALTEDGQLDRLPGIRTFRYPAASVADYLNRKKKEVR